MGISFKRLLCVTLVAGPLAVAGAGAASAATLVANPNAPDMKLATALNTGKLLAPPPVMMVTKIVVKPGRLAEVEALAVKRADALRQAGWPRVTIATVTVTGTPQIWLLTRYDRIGAIAEDAARIDNTPALKATLAQIDASEADLIESKRVVTLGYEPDISYRPDFNWSQARFFEIIWVHTRNGHHEAYLDNRRMTREEHDRGAFDTHQMMYAVKTGEQSGTFFVMRPMRSLGLLDELHAVDDGEPETPAEAAKKIQDFADSTLTEEEAYFRVLPEASLLP